LRRRFRKLRLLRLRTLALDQFGGGVHVDTAENTVAQNSFSNAAKEEQPVPWHFIFADSDDREGSRAEII